MPAPGFQRTRTIMCCMGSVSGILYVHGGCAADTVVVRGLGAPGAVSRRRGGWYLGISFGGGIGALALPWDERFHRAHLNVPSFGHHPLRLGMPCVGSGEAVRRHQRRTGQVLIHCATLTPPLLRAIYASPCTSPPLASIRRCRRPPVRGL